MGLIGWKHEMRQSNKEQISELIDKGHNVIPVFLINNQHYIPKQFGKANKPAYPGMEETSIDVFHSLQNIKFME